MEFIGGPKPAGCIFCDFPAAPAADDRRNLIVHRDEHAFVILNRYPYNSGHLMVVPRRHGADLDALPRAEWDGLQALLRRTAAVLRATHRPDGLNLGMNLGQAGGRESSITFTGTWCRAGAATTTSCRCWPTCG